MQRLFRVITITILLAGCGNKSDQTKQNRIEPEAISVKVSQVKETTISETVKITGEIAPFYKIDVFPKANGIVVSESVSAGADVKNGQVLAEVKQDIPGMEFANVKIEATNNGFITLDAVEIGGRVSVQRAVYQISQLKPIYMVAKVTETLLGKIKIGDAVEVKVDAYPDMKFDGKITEVSPVVDPISRMAKIKIKLNNSKLLLKPGMFALAFLKVGNHKGLALPLDAIVRSGAARYVFLVQQGTAKQIKIETGTILQDKIEVRGNLKAGNKIVVMGQNLIKDGTAVKIVEGN